MTPNKEKITVELIPIDQIMVINPRARNKRAFKQIVDSISKIGLKKPITVNRNPNTGDPANYHLVCGQGRLEAFIQLGEREIPAIVVDVSEEDSLVMSLVENLARRKHLPMELLQDIGELAKRGNTDTEIAAKTGLSYEYVHSIRHLLEEGEERLLSAVETGKIPLSVAIDIAEADEEGVQEALADAYQNGFLRGKKLLVAKRLVEQRQRRGKAIRRGPSSMATQSPMSSETLVRTYEKEVQRQRLIIRRAEVTQNRLLFIVQGVRQLLADENFLTLLRAEGLETMPRPLADLVAIAVAK